MSWTIEVTELRKASGILSKKIALGDDGKPVSDGSECRLTAGTARRHRMNGDDPAGALADFITGMDARTALTLGVMSNAIGDEVRVTSRARHTDGAITRTLDHFAFTNGMGWVLLDHDTKSMTEAAAAALDALGGPEGAFRHLIPGYDTVARVTRASTSSGLRNARTGEQFAGSGGRHDYVLIQDQSDAQRMLKVLHGRAWLAGLGWFMVGTAGQLLERSIIDVSVASPERLVFEGRPAVVPPLVQGPRAAIPSAGTGALDSRAAVPDLTAAEKAKCSALMAAERRRLRPESEKEKKEWVACEGAKLGPDGEAVVMAALEKRTLSGAWPLAFDDDDLGVVTVGTVLADPEKYDGETLADPIDGIAYGRGKAMVFANTNGSVIINSFAHGGRTFRLLHSAASAREVVDKAGKDDIQAVIDTILRAGLSAIEEAQIIDLAAKRTGVGKRPLKADLKQARAAADTDADFDYLADEDVVDPDDPDPELLERNGYRIRFRSDGHQLRGLYYRQRDGGWVRFATLPVKIEGRTRTEDSTGWGLLLSVCDDDGRTHRSVLPLATLAANPEEFRRVLGGLGLRLLSPIAQSRMKLEAYFSEWPTPDRARTTDRIGWHDRAFVLPDATIGHSDGEQVLLQREGRLPVFKAAGTLESWREKIAKPATGNAIPVFGISIGFAGPLLNMVGQESGGFHLDGQSSIGKTAALHAASSIWGVKAGSWRSTDNAAEITAANVSDTFLGIDEIGEGEAKAVAALIYMLANEAGKKRMDRNISAREPLRWRVLFLSTGEMSINTKLEEKGIRARAGQAVRCLDIPVGDKYGIYAVLNGFTKGEDLSDHFRDHYHEHCGHVGRAWLEHLTQDYDTHAETARRLQRKFVAKYTPKGSDGQVLRAAARFGIVAAGGELATWLGLTGWRRGEATRAARKCFERWREQRGGIGAAEVMDGVRQVRRILESGGTSRFQPSWEQAEHAEQIGGVGGHAAPPPPTPNRLGFRRTDKDGSTTYYVQPEQWRAEVCQGFDPGMIARAMVARSWLLKGDGKHLTLKWVVPGQGKRRLYTIPPNFMAAEDVKDEEAGS